MSSLDPAGGKDDIDLGNELYVLKYWLEYVYKGDKAKEPLIAGYSDLLQEVATRLGVTPPSKDWIEAHKTRAA